MSLEKASWKARGLWVGVLAMTFVVTLSNVLVQFHYSNIFSKSSALTALAR